MKRLNYQTGSQEKQHKTNDDDYIELFKNGDNIKYDCNKYLNKSKRYARSYLLANNDKGTYEAITNKNNVIMGRNLRNLTNISLTNDHRDQMMKRLNRSLGTAPKQNYALSKNYLKNIRMNRLKQRKVVDE